MSGEARARRVRTIPAGDAGMLEDILEALPSSVFVKGEGHRTRKTLHSVSGYAHDIISKAGVRDSGIEVPRRLFATARLQERVRKVLDSDG
jgi:hypothetical protein